MAKTKQEVIEEQENMPQEIKDLITMRKYLVLKKSKMEAELERTLREIHEIDKKIDIYEKNKNNN